LKAFLVKVIRLPQLNRPCLLLTKFEKDRATTSSNI